MQIFDSGLFWFTEGMLCWVMLLGLKVWAEDRSVPTPWWKWVAFMVWVCVAGFTIAFVGTSVGEGETTAAIRGGLLFGFLAALSGVGVWRVLLIGAVNDQSKDAKA